MQYIYKFQKILPLYKDSHRALQFFFINTTQNNSTMFPDDQLRLIIGATILIPLSYFIRFIKPTKYRYIYSLLLSFLIQLYVFKQQMIGLYIQSIIVFFLIKMFKSKKIGAIITIQSMLFLSIYQIRQIMYDYGGWTMNASALLMILVCKYSLFAYAIQDGLTNQEKLTEEQKTFRLTNEVSFYDYIGFLNFLPSSLIGPPLEYVQYKKFMQLQKPYNQIPETVSQTLKSIAYSAVCAAIFLAGQYITPISYMKTDQFYQHNAFYVLFYSFLSMTFIRFKYYFGWKLSIASIHASGVSYNGHKFNLISTCSPLVIQTDKHIRSKISHWNTAVQQWLRKCIYQRSPFKSKGVSQLYVFMISAFWHGFYAGYYFSFFLWFVQVYTQGEIFKFVKSQNSRLRQFYKGLGIFGAIFLTFIVNLIFSHNATFFILLDHNLCFKLLQKVNYIPQTILITLAFTFTLLNMTRSKHTKQVRLKNPTAIAQKDQTEKPFKTN